MSDSLNFKVKTFKPGNRENAGHPDYHDETIAMGDCPHCDHAASFKQIGTCSQSLIWGYMVALKCENCESILSYTLEEKKAFPAPRLNGISDLPEEIESYYQEALRCISADAPNGAATVFRKVIHAVCLYYDVAEVDDNSSIYSMVNKLADGGHIVERQRKALLATKDAGNDAAHINENDPDIEQAKRLKELVDAVLNATVKVDENIELSREEHPNPHQE